MKANNGSTLNLEGKRASDEVKPANSPQAKLIEQPGSGKNPAAFDRRF